MKPLRLALVPALAAIALAARAQSIGVSYGDGSANATLAAATVAGASAYAQANWNNVATAGATALRNSSGTATAASAALSVASGDYLHFSPTRGTSGGGPAGGDELLNNGIAYTDLGGLTLSLANIPYSSYSLVVYSLNAVTSAPIRLTLGASTLWLRPPANPIGAGYVDYNAATPFIYTQSSSATQSGAPANSDYAVFAGLSGASQTLTLLGNDVNNDGTHPSSLAGFQIVNTSAVPETSALAALGLGAASLLRRRRRA